VAGPSVGGALVALATAPLALLTDAASFLASAAWLRHVRDPAPAPEETSAGQAEGARFIARSPLIRPILAATATLNLFTLAFFALFILYATRALHVAPGLLGALLGAGAVGAVLGSLVTRRIAAAIGVGPAFVAGCALFPAPLLLVPLAGELPSAAPLLLFAAEFGSGFGVMVLDINAGAILAAAVPDELRARVAGAYQLVNYGVRPLGALAGGVLGARLGLQPTLWLAAAGALASVLWLPRAPVMRLRTLPEAG
jgi:predicted MFS family arabinose efflux permease